MKTEKNQATHTKATTPRQATAADARGRAAKLGDHHVGRALRSAYQETVQEEIPREMLDLLDKLS